MEIFGKVTTVAGKQDGSTINETLGYTRVNPFSASSATSVATLLRFGQAVTGLTTNFYRKTNVTYEVALDTWDAEEE